MRRHLKLLLMLLLLVAPIAPAARGQQTSTPPPPAPPQTFSDPAEWLRAGPLLGASEMTSTEVWLQTRRPVRAQLRFWRQGKPETARLSRAVETTPDADLIARFGLENLEFGSKYDYEVYLDGLRVALPYPATFQTVPNWRYRTDPPAFRIALGSCVYVNDPPFDRPGTPYGGDFEIFTAIAAQKPDLMLWLGDNLYYREGDWFSETAMRRRNAHDRELRVMQPLFASTHNYAIWDDHDFGPNDSDRTFRGREWALRIFKDYWANASWGTEETPGVFGRFEWGDIEFFLVDDRYHRTPNEMSDAAPDKVMLGDAQMRWLTESLRSSTATFKIIASGSQMMNPLVFYEAWGHFPAEQKRFIDFVRENRIPGVLFLSGDRHHTELIRRVEPGLYPLYDFTSSPLTSGAGRNDKEADNPMRVPQTWVTGVRNFGIIDVSGKAKERVLTLRTLDKTGKELWRRQINAAELQFPQTANQPTGGK